MEEALLRHELALERTRLANERTLLAYVRTSLALMGGGAALFQFFASKPWLHGLAWGLIVFGALALIVGFQRFVRVNRHLRRGPDPTTYGH